MAPFAVAGAVLERANERLRDQIGCQIPRNTATQVAVNRAKVALEYDPKRTPILPRHARASASDNSAICLWFPATSHEFPRLRPLPESEARNAAQFVSSSPE
jgi:hypothetical protein